MVEEIDFENRHFFNFKSHVTLTPDLGWPWKSYCCECLIDLNKYHYLVCGCIVYDCGHMHGRTYYVRTDITTQTGMYNFSDSDINTQNQQHMHNHDKIKHTALHTTHGHGKWNDKHTTVIVIETTSVWFTTRNPKVIWEEQCRCPSRREWTRLLCVLLAVQCSLQTSPIT